MTGVAEVLAVLDFEMPRSRADIAEEVSASADIVSAHLNNLQKLGKAKRTGEGWIRTGAASAAERSPKDINRLCQDHIAATGGILHEDGGALKDAAGRIHYPAAAETKPSKPEKVAPKDPPTLHGEVLHARIVDALRAAGTAGMSRTSIRDLLNRNAPAAVIDAAMIAIESRGDAFRKTVQTGGRPCETWFIIGAVPFEPYPIPRASAMAKPDKAETSTALNIDAAESKPAAPRFVDAKVEERRERGPYTDALLDLRSRRDKLDAAIAALEALG